MDKNYYEVLGVDKGAEPEAIKKAYRSLSMQHHPDKGGDAEKFKEISVAYSVLSDPEKRKDYDNPMRNAFGGFNPFEEMMRGFGGRSQRPNPNGPRKGRNLMSEQELPLKFFILGGKIKVNFKFRDVCTACNGTGAEETIMCSACNGRGRVIEGQQGQGVFIQHERPCSPCNGRGFRTDKECKVCIGQGNVEAERDIELGVPVGIRDGQVIGAVGHGASGVNGGPSGDLTVRLHMKYPKIEELTKEQRKILGEL